MHPHPHDERPGHPPASSRDDESHGWTVLARGAALLYLAAAGVGWLFVHGPFQTLFPDDPDPVWTLRGALWLLVGGLALVAIVLAWRVAFVALLAVALWRGARTLGAIERHGALHEFDLLRLAFHALAAFLAIQALRALRRRGRGGPSR